MRTIWKYKIPIQDHCQIEMPKGAEILCFDAQDDTPCIWCLVDPMAKNELRKFRLVGTGHAITERHLSYFGTCQLRGGMLIYHLFEMEE